jgi:acyl-CoA thioester hydrolase
MKPNPQRLVLEAYPFACTINTRLRDSDGQNHLNNSAIAMLYSEARARIRRPWIDADSLSPGRKLVVARQSIAYLAEGFHPQDVQVGSAIVAIGRTSLSLGQGLFQSGACIGTCDIVLVHWIDGGPHEIPPDMRAELEASRLRD